MKVLTIAFSLYILSSLCLAQNSANKFSCRIAVEVEAKGQLQEQVSSYVNRELRGLGDVLLVEDKPTIRVKILAIKNTSADSGQHLGYTLSLVVTRLLDIESLKTIIAGQVKKDDFSLIENYLDERYTLIEHYLTVGGPNSLKNLCEEIVTQLDVSAIEIERKDWQKRQEAIQKYLDQQKRKTRP